MLNFQEKRSAEVQFILREVCACANVVLLQTEECGTGTASRYMKLCYTLQRCRWADRTYHGSDFEWVDKLFDQEKDKDLSKIRKNAPT